MNDWTPVRCDEDGFDVRDTIKVFRGMLKINTHSRLPWVAIRNISSVHLTDDAVGVRMNNGDEFAVSYGSTVEGVAESVATAAHDKILSLIHGENYS